MKSVSLREFKRCPEIAGRGLVVRVLWELVSLMTLRNPLCVFGFINRGALTLFGAKLGAGVVIKQDVHVKYPWKLVVGEHVWIGERVWIDNIEGVQIGSNVCLSQGAYLCTGNHDWSRRDFPLTAKPIVIEDGVWVGAKAVIGPGVTLGSHSVVTVGSVVMRNTEPFKVYQGNPAVCVKDRVIK